MKCWIRDVRELFYEKAYDCVVKFMINMLFGNRHISVPVNYFYRSVIGEYNDIR